MPPANKATEPQAETAEPGKGRTPIWENKRDRFPTLLHHLTVDLLRESDKALGKSASPGVDGVRWAESGAGREGRLAGLKNRIHWGSYRAQPTRRIDLAKANGQHRPIGIAALKVKIVQLAVVTIRQAMYEVDFQGRSYRFRPGRSPRDGRVWA